MGNCSRCGRQASVEYGLDGLAYCSSCSFYGLNKQCWKCRMYVPATELQQYRGQWTCPICLQDMRSERIRESEYKPEKHKMQALAIPETCERCGRDTEILYYWNGRMLCKSCLDEAQQSWGLVGGGPMGAGQAIRVTSRGAAEKESLLARAINEFLVLLGLRKRKKKVASIVAVSHPHMPIDHARPMAEGRMKKGGKRDDERKIPQSESIIKKSRRRKKKKGKNDVSFPEYKEKKKSKEKEGKKEGKKKGKKKADDDENPFSRFKDEKK
jgi:hypothetical protein